MSLDTNIAPYFDDFDKSKNYVKVLFKPGNPVQTRELNQVQSISAQQRERLSSHMFKNGSRVNNGSVSIISLEWVRVKDKTPNDIFTSEDVKLDHLPKEMLLRGQVSEVEASLITTTEKDQIDPATLYVIYSKYGKDAEQTRFLPGEIVDCIDEHGNIAYQVQVRCPECAGSEDFQDQIDPCGYGSRMFVVDSGTYYYDGYFIENNKSNVIFSKYRESNTCKIGFDVIETIVTADDDESLYDNSLGYPNMMSPGADRIAYNLNLVIRTKEITDGVKFIELATIKDGYIQTIKSDFQYADIMDTMARQIYEQAGNYTVNAFPVRYREHKKESADDYIGFKLDGDESLIQAVVGTGIGYVKGYRQETLYEKLVDVPKARTTKATSNGSIYFENLASVDLIPDTDNLSIWPNSPTSNSVVTMKEIQLYDGVPASGTPSGKVIGSIIVTDCTYVGKNENNKDVYRYYIVSCKLSEPAGNVKCVSSETSRFLAVPAGGIFSVQNSSQMNLIYPIGKNNIKSLRNIDNSNRGSMIISTRKKFKASLSPDGKYTFTISNGTFDSNITDSVMIVGTAGNYVSIKPTSTNITPSGVTLSVKLGSEHGNKNISLIHNVTSIQLLEKTKQSMTHIIKDIKRTDTNNFKDKIELQRGDVYHIEYVTAYKSSDPTSNDNVTNKFILDSGITPYMYGMSSLKLKDNELIDNQFDMIEIKLRYLEHSNMNNTGYFTVDSYTNVINDKDSLITYKNLPAAVTSNGKSYSVAEILDFRPLVLDYDNVTGEVPSYKSTAIFDMEYYVPRKDYLCLDKDGNIFHEMGVPSESPRLPVNLPPDIMPLYEVTIPAYTYSYKDIKVKYIENKRYTMRDIGRIEDRVKNVEYYVTLSMLESETAAAEVKDANGFNRFKNGFVVDDFGKHGTGDTANPEFKATIDRGRKELRPSYNMYNRPVTFDRNKSKNYVVKNDMAMIEYTHELVDEQPFASRPLSINPYLIFRKAGNLLLSPNVDNWSDTNRVPEMNIDIDTGVDAIEAIVNRQNSIITAFNDWAFANSTISSNGSVSTGLGTLNRETNVVSSSTTSQSRVNTPASTVATNGGRVVTSAGTSTSTTTTTTTNTTTTDTRTESHGSIESRTDTYPFDRVTDVEIIPYMRETSIMFLATNLMPNTRYFVFFDNQDVSEFTNLVGSSDKINSVISLNMLLSDDKGTLGGIVNIPAGRFFTGTKEFRVTNDKTNSKNEQLETSFAEAQFFAGGLNLSKQEINMNVITPVFSERDVVTSSSKTDTRVNVNTVTRNSGGVSSFIPNPRPNRNSGRDPVAQSFKIDFDCMISKADIFFEAVDVGSEVWVELREMMNGYPTEIVLTRKDLDTTKIKTSLDATVPTEIEFANPVRIQSGIEYCIVVGGNSPSTRIWIARLGETAVNADNKTIDTQISLGSCFRSQNGSTWNAEQYEDMMFKLYCAKFKYDKLTVNMNVSGGVEFSELDDVPFESENNNNLIRVYTKNDHGLVTGDKVQVQLYPDAEYHITLTNGHLVPGHELQIDGAKSFGIVKSVEYETPTTCIVKFSMLTGNISDTSLFTASPFLRKIENKDVIEAYYDLEVEDHDIKQAAGKFTKVVGVEKLNGVPLNMLNKVHQVKRVDDNKTFIIEVDEAPTASGRFGPKGSLAIVNLKYDMFNLSGAYMLHNCTEEWIMNGVSHGETNSLFENDNYTLMNAKTFYPYADRYLDRPYKVASLINENEKMAGQKSINFVATFKSDTKYLSPVLNIKTFSTVFVSNDIGWLTKTVFNQSPNDVDRFIPETHKADGSEHCKYVTKTAMLKNPAADLRIWLDVFKPGHADIEMYVKLQTTDVENIDDIDWIKIEGYDNSFTSLTTNDINEIDLLLSDIMPTITGTSNLFSAFKFKIVSKSKNSAIPPLIKNLRLIAYT